MINVTLVASTPQEAYALAKEKYGSDFTLISAKQIRYGAHDKLSCEITVSISKERFLQPNEVSQKAESTEEPSLLQDQLSKMKSLLKDKI